MLGRANLADGGHGGKQDPLQNLRQLITRLELKIDGGRYVSLSSPNGTGKEDGAPPYVPPNTFERTQVDELSSAIAASRAALQSSSEKLSDSQALEVWRLSTRLWNLCCGLAPSSAAAVLGPNPSIAQITDSNSSLEGKKHQSQASKKASEELRRLQARLRHLTCDLLSLAPCTRADILHLHSITTPRGSINADGALVMATQAVLQRVVWHSRAGQAWLQLGQLEDAELCMSRGKES